MQTATTTPDTATLVTQRQEALSQRYLETPELAQVFVHARAASPGSDPFHGRVRIGDSHEKLDFGIHRAVGGDHDRPNPGDLLCAALTACLDATTRMVASRLGIQLTQLEIEAHAHADVRGCLLIDREVPAGFLRIDVDVKIAAEQGTDPEMVARLAATARRCSVVFQTLQGNPGIETRFKGPQIDAVHG